MEDKLSLNKLSSYHKEYLFFHYFCIVTFKINIMRFYQITPNLSISDDSNFGNYDHKIIYELLTSISSNFSKHLNLISSSVPPCRITYINTNPRCSNIMSERWIFLHVSQDYWCQWIYQFAHEYCHHLINGAMSDDIIGLIWFEESIVSYLLCIIFINYLPNGVPVMIRLNSDTSPLSRTISTI